MADVKALCDRVVLILDGQGHYDGPISNFEKLLGKDKFVSVTFNQAPNRSDALWEEFSPAWTDDYMQVELRIPENLFQETASKIITEYSVADFSTDKLPIERVMQTILSNPKLLKPQGRYAEK